MFCSWDLTWFSEFASRPTVSIVRLHLGKYNGVTRAGLEHHNNLQCLKGHDFSRAVKPPIGSGFQPLRSFCRLNTPSLPEGKVFLHFCSTFAFGYRGEPAVLPAICLISAFRPQAMSAIEAKKHSHANTSPCAV